MYQSVSAFNPVCNPTNCQWGQKAFKGFLGSVEAGVDYDATLLVGKYEGPKLPILVDQGTSDVFIAKNQLRTEEFRVACGKANYPLILRNQPGYDHGYFAICSFMKDHIAHHAAHLGLAARDTK